MSIKVMMKCGHSANAISEGKPACVICESFEVDSDQPDLAGRKARCSYYGISFTHRGRSVTCRGESESSLNLPFFKHKPSKEYDEYYCGCWGWD